MKIIGLFLLGLCFGSFVTALTWRLRELGDKKLTKARRRKLSIVRGRSMCSKCGHTLAWYDLVPFVSWLSLRGKCRYCHKPISEGPREEILTASLFILSYLAWPHGWDSIGLILFCLWLIFVVGFVALAVYDLRWMELPDKIVYPLIGLAVAQVLLLSATDGVGMLPQAFYGFLTIGGLFYGLFQVSAGRWIGGGDVKLSFVIGPLVGGPLESLMVIFLASLVGTVASLPMMARRRLKTSSRIPFGPFLLAATVVVYLYGTRIVDWYTSLFL